VFYPYGVEFSAAGQISSNSHEGLRGVRKKSAPRIAEEIDDKVEVLTVKPVEKLQLLESCVPAEIDGEDFVEVRILFKERDAALVAEVGDIRIRKSVAQRMDER